MKETSFSYLTKKIMEAPFTNEPFKFVYIEDFFSAEHFHEITTSPEVDIGLTDSDENLFNTLDKKGYKPIPFPGCITDTKKYLGWHNQRKRVKHHSTCEGFGMAMRLFSPKTPILYKLKDFLESQKFNQIVAEKFGIQISECTIDGGIQKYLDGYEISPHPDIRRKAATFMVNINPSQNSEQENYHTHYLKLKKEKSYIESFWEGNSTIDRAWIPWDWADSKFQQSKNNSIVLFAPSNNSIHAVKASYNHLTTQRTQLYGNLWFQNQPPLSRIEWQHLDLKEKAKKTDQWHWKKSIKKHLPHHLIEYLRKMGKNSSIGKRNL